MAFYTHRHFYVTKNFVGEYLLYAGYTPIARFKKRYWADKARKYLQYLLDSFQFSSLAHEIWLFRGDDSLILEFRRCIDK